MRDQKIPGWNFLHNHIKLEADLDLDRDLVIVRRDEWEKIVKLFIEHPELKEKLKLKV